MKDTIMPERDAYGPDPFVTVQDAPRRDDDPDMKVQPPPRRSAHGDEIEVARLLDLLPEASRQMPVDVERLAAGKVRPVHAAVKGGDELDASPTIPTLEIAPAALVGNGEIGQPETTGNRQRSGLE